jgi:hypothetical protein
MRWLRLENAANLLGNFPELSANFLGQGVPVSTWLTIGLDQLSLAMPESSAVVDHNSVSNFSGECLELIQG